MREWLGRLDRFLRKENSGSSIVIVIVALAFVGILGATIMWMSLNNYLMKATDRRTKESFYSAEAVLEQIVAGLQKDASDATEHSYSYVMQNYANWNEQKRNSKFAAEYLNQLQKILSGGTGADVTRYQLSRLASYVDGSIGLSIDAAVPGDPKRLLQTVNVNADGSIDYSQPTGEIVRPADEDYLLLKGFRLEFVDARGFLSVIDTDIMISAPPIAFTQSSVMPDVFEFCIIADRRFENTASSGRVTVNGNLYAGEEGIAVYHEMRLQNSERIISKGPVTLLNSNARLLAGGAETDDIPQFWAENIDLKAGEAVLHAKTYVADDLTMNGVGTKVSLEEEYYGYGSSTSDSAKSSAIMINGIDNTLDMTKLNKLLIAGHSYIGTSKAASADGKPLVSPVDQEVSDANAASNTDILMGESIAVKGNQIAYLIPEECIGVVDGNTVIGKNPLSGAEYTAMMTQYGGDAAFNEVSFSKTVSQYGGGTSLSAYASDFRKIFAPSNGETMVYYYMVLSEENANRFFKDFYGLQKSAFDRYFNIYSSGGILAGTFARIHMQGNYMTSEATGLPGMPQAVTLHDAMPQDEQELSEETGRYTEINTALTRKLIENYYGLTESEMGKTVFENIIKKAEAELFAGNGTKRFTLEDGMNAVITGAATYEYGASGDSKTRLIVALHDVTVSRDFTGMIIAGGVIKVEAGVTLNSAESKDAKSELVRVLQCESSDTDPRRPIDFFVNGGEYVLDGTPVSPSEDGIVAKAIDVTQLVRYQNWIKK
ncbi:MAG: hypothetical protein QM697_08700 [Lachnospiraceae bacterium]